MNTDAPSSLGSRRPARTPLPPFPPRAIPRAAAADESVTPDASAAGSSSGVRSPPGSSYSTLSSPGYSSSGGGSMSLSPYKTTPSISPVLNYQRRQEPSPQAGLQHRHSFGEKLPGIASLIPPPGPSQYGPLHTPPTTRAGPGTGPGHLALPIGMVNMSLNQGQGPSQVIPPMLLHSMPHGLPTMGQSFGAISPEGNYHEFSISPDALTGKGTTGKGRASGNYLVARESSQQDRPFKCDQCTQCFSRNHDLKRHKRIHMASKPFPCPHCDKCFSRKDALKRHSVVKACNGTKSPSQFLLVAPAGPEPEPGPDLEEPEPERGNSVGSSVSDDEESPEYAKSKSPR
ncbi:hypothetical protein B0T19DRAFT_290906 [Cercophora scortea]|uniref:C2H2-type domain-containing protein n=1 Tax=Cercophora scortea TaxID=314031 RepID=A0AAE0I2S4_9PEZI|nr:hypothetical protein B0T19DRAFT_290906 [Cercophora scortea]